MIILDKKVNAIVTELNNRGYKAKATVVNKNGTKVTGITIGEGEMVPVIYPNVNHTVEQCVSEIINTYKRTPKDEFDVKSVTSWEYAKNNLQLCLQKKTDEDILKRDYLDLEMYVRVKIEFPDKATYKVKPGMFKEVSEDKIFARAFMQTREDIKIENMAEMFASMMGCDVSEIAGMDSPAMIVITNKEKIYGASGICDKEMLNEIAEKYKSSLIILPSSIHECIICLDNDPYMKAYNEMVCDVNNKEVADIDVLSDHAYFFNRKTKEIEW